MSPVLIQMRSIASQWEAAADQRSIFLTCYSIMTANMLAAVDAREFEDPVWVDHLLHRFAAYYFDALADYDGDPAVAPPVWKLAHDQCRDSKVWAVQKLLLGVNAHINFDLVLTLDELLVPDWAELAERQRESRQRDYLLVNDIIGRTIDRVQDEVLSEAMPVMRMLDLAMGPADEALLSRLLIGWRDRVWAYAVELVEAPDLEAREAIIRRVEEEAMRRAHAVRRVDDPLIFWQLFR